MEKGFNNTVTPSAAGSSSQQGRGVEEAAGLSSDLPYIIL